MDDATRYSVPEVSCQHCVDAITNEVAAVVGVTLVEVDLVTKTVTVAGGDKVAIMAAIHDAGYDIN